jgi:hypothetical protein
MNATWTEVEVKRMLWLRAIEWNALPSFVSQPFVPILFIFFPWVLVIFVVMVLSVIWVPIRYLFVNFRVATVACLFVVWCKWPASIGSSIYLFIHHQPVPAVIALLWPFLAGYIGIPGKVGITELAFAKKIGFVSQDAEL